MRRAASPWAVAGLSLGLFALFIAAWAVATLGGAGGAGGPAVDPEYARLVGAAAAANASQISGSGMGVSGVAGILPSAVYGYDASEPMPLLSAGVGGWVGGWVGDGDGS